MLASSKACVFWFFFLLALPFSSYSSDGLFRHYNPQNHYWGVILGVGGGSSLRDDFGGFSWAIIPSYQHGNHIYNLRHSRIFEFYMEGPQPERFLADTSFLYGRCKKGDYYYVSLSAGPGIVQGMDRGDPIGEPAPEQDLYEERPFAALSLSLDAQFFIITPNFGIGIYMMSGFNEKQSYYAFLLSFKFGYLVDVW